VRTRTLSELLATHSLFSRLDAAGRAALAGCARNRRFRAGAMIQREGDPAEAILLLRAGDAAIEIAAPGRPPLRVETVHPGGVIGWGWLAPPHRCMADARALTDLRATALDAACLRARCDARPEIGYALLKAWAEELTERMRAQRLQLLDLYGDHAA
jgi:cAMP-binding proteins - catabolite gene activator and regulatory subunit of cAMP-dependent protein kinases